MSIDYGFSFFVGEILESSNTLSPNQQFSYRSEVETTSKMNFINKVYKRKNNSGASNKTRKRSSQTRTVKTTSLTDDGYGWRKYGQKKINNDLHPKSYYRCTHHLEENCEAKKWVQQESDEPPVYKTTYLGSHTCRNPLKIPQILLPDYSASSSEDSSYESKPVFLCFDPPTSNINSSNITGQIDFAPSSSSPSSSSTQPADFMAFPEESATTECCINMEESIQEDQYLCDFPPMGSPSCKVGSYDFNLMMGDYSLLDLDCLMNSI